MKDIQSQQDHRRINIKKVGVKDIAYPITVLDKANRLQRTVASFNMYVNLPHHFKGTHMSRFIEILNRFHGAVELGKINLVLQEMKERLVAEAAHVEIEFPFFLKKRVEHANVVNIGEYGCRMHGSLGEEDDLIMEVGVPIAPPLPCQDDQALPRSLGHWGTARVALRFRHFIWIEDVIEAVEEVIARHRSAAVAPEPFRTGREPGGGLSVESIAKGLGRKLSGHPDIRWLSITVENLAEGYSTFACLEWPPGAS